MQKLLVNWSLSTGWTEGMAITPFCTPSIFFQLWNSVRNCWSARKSADASVLLAGMNSPPTAAEP